MSASIGFEINLNQIGILTLNRPDSRNALNWEMMEGFRETIEGLKSPVELKALIVTGAGGAFCAGGDLFELHHCTTQADGQRLARIMGDALARMAQLPIPVLAAIEGPAIGGGAEIALACDIRVASETATIGLPQIHLAVTPAWGGAGRLIDLLGYPAAFTLLTSGELLTSQQASALGLVQHVVPEGQALEAAATIVSTLTALDPAALHAVKSILLAHQELDAEQAASFERSLFADLWAADAHRQKSSQFIQRRS